MKEEGLTQEEARIAVDRDNLTAAIRSGLIREDAPDLVKSLTDAQITALCPNGNPPRFAPVKRVRGGTRQKPKYEPEKWRKGSQGGVIHISRDTNAQHLAKVANVENPKAPTPTAPTGRGSSPLRPAPATPTPTRQEQERAKAVNAILDLLPDEEQREYHAHTFDNCPVNVVKKIRESVEAIEYSDDGGAHCIRQTVYLSKNTGGWGNTPSSIRHECGHTVFHKIIRNLPSSLSVEEIREKFAPIITAAKNDMAKWGQKIYGADWERFTKRFSGNWYEEIGLRTFGFDLASLDRKKVTEEIKTAGSVSDVFCSVFKGYRFDGHDRYYYRRRRIGDIDEIIADITSLAGGRYAEKAREILPLTFAKVEELIY